MKVRVKQIGELYYPQYRFLFVWNTFQEMVGIDVLNTVKFGVLEDAIKYAKKATYKIHPVSL